MIGIFIQEIVKMEDIHIEGAKNSFIMPSVDFVAATGECSICGESFLEEPGKFYAPLIDWIRNYAETKKKLTFTFKLSYFNTSTSKWVLAIIAEIKKMKSNGIETVVNWYYHVDDVDMRDDVSDYVCDTGMDINLVPFDE